MSRALKLKKKPEEPVRCEMCGEGIGPGIRPTSTRHADPAECFKALMRARTNLLEIVRALVEEGHGKARTIKLDLAIERDAEAVGGLVFSVIATSPLGDEAMLARLAAPIVGQMAIEAFNAGLSVQREPVAEEGHDSNSAD